MAIISYDPDEVVDYIPESERGSEDPCIISMTFVSYAKMKKYSELLSQKTKGFRITDERMQQKQGEVQEKQFCDNIKEVKNFLVKGKEIKTAEELYANASQALITELIRAMEDNAKLTEGQLKNSQGDSAGTS